jgi:hypothetical protein
MKLILKKPMLNANGGQPISELEIKFRDLGEFGTNSKSFELLYILNDQFSPVTALFLEDKEVPIYYENGAQTGTEIRGVRKFLPSKITSKKSNEEIRQILSTIEVEDVLSKFIILYFIVVKDALESIIGEGTITIEK